MDEFDHLDEIRTVPCLGTVIHQIVEYTVHNNFPLISFPLLVTFYDHNHHWNLKHHTQRGQNSVIRILDSSCEYQNLTDESKNNGKDLSENKEK